MTFRKGTKVEFDIRVDGKTRVESGVVVKVDHRVAVVKVGNRDCLVYLSQLRKGK